MLGAVPLVADDLMVRSLTVARAGPWPGAVADLTRSPAPRGHLPLIVVLVGGISTVWFLQAQRLGWTREQRAAAIPPAKVLLPWAVLGLVAYVVGLVHLPTDDPLARATFITVLTLVLVFGIGWSRRRAERTARSQAHDTPD